MIVVLIILSLIPCSWLIIRKHAKLRRAEQYDAAIVDYEIKRDSDSGGQLYRLIAQYEDSRATAHLVKGDTSSSRPARRVGDTVKVLHHADGQRDELLLFEDLYLLEWIWFCFGVSVLGFLIASPLLWISVSACLLGCKIGQPLVEWLYAKRPSHVK